MCFVFICFLSVTTENPHNSNLPRKKLKFNQNLKQSIPSGYLSHIIFLFFMIFFYSHMNIIGVWCNIPFDFKLIYTYIYHIYILFLPENFELYTFINGMQYLEGKKTKLFITNIWFSYFYWSLSRSLFALFVNFGREDKKKTILRLNIFILFWF